MSDKENTMELPTTPKPGYVTVYDKEGVAHSMLTANARDMVQHLGWAYNVIKAKATGGVVVLVSKTNPVAKDAKPTESDRVDLHTLTQEGLIAFAKEHFDMDFEADVSRDAIINAILTEQA